MTSKGDSYISALVDARCDGRWNDVPELARKVEKHSKKRSILLLASKAGAAVHNASTRTQYREIEQKWGPPLRHEVPLEPDFSIPDVTDAAVALATISYGLGVYDAVLSQATASLCEVPPPDQGFGEQGLKAVSVVKGTLLRGLACEHTDNQLLAAQTYRSMIAYLSHIIRLPKQCSELRRWSEELLCHICVFFSTNHPDRSVKLGEAMATFHVLTKHLDSKGWQPLSSSFTYARHTPRAVWRAYYEALSVIVRDDLVYHPSPEDRTEGIEGRGYLSDEDYVASRIQQRADLRRVEVNYEQLLLRETTFPKASESNHEVLSWVELVMGNWRTLCGPRWTDEELGSGGKLVVGRSTLDILYRAVTKTFHSTQILRHLFTVHAFLGEFDLALKAFDSYVEIMTRGKARAERSGSAGLEIDDDAMAVKTAAEAIRISCRYGSDEVAERTLHTGERLQSWIEKGTTQTDLKALRQTEDDAQGQREPVSAPSLPPEILLVAYTAIGTSQANYARSVPTPALRSELQAKALKNLRSSYDLETSCQAEALYAYALALAETRDIPEAVNAVKRALDRAEGIEGLTSPDGMIGITMRDAGASHLDRFNRRRKTLPIWHLLAQLLCAKEDYEMASTCLSVALEQFDSTAKLLASMAPQRSNDHYRHTSPPPQSRQSSRRAGSRSPFDRLESFEKHTLIEMKLTQLSLTELLEGVEAAINASHDVFALYNKLFGVQDLTNMRPSTNATATLPKSSSGTVRSMFGRSKGGGTVRSAKPSTLPTANTSAMTSRPNTAAAPAIQVTAANGTVTDPKPSTDVGSRRNTLKKRNSGSVRRQASTVSRPTTAQVSERTSLDRNQGFAEANGTATGAESGMADGRLMTVESRGQTFNSVAHNMPTQYQPLPLRQHQQPPSQDVRLPVSGPSSSGAQATIAHASSSDSPHPQFNKLQEWRQANTLIIKMWLFTAQLYTSCSIFHSASAAIEEANKHVAAVEAAIAQEYGASVKNFQVIGWGGGASGRSVEQLWADVCTARGKMLAAQGKPHDAMPQFERALMHDPDHAGAIVALSNILLDIYEEIVPLEKPDPDAIVIPTPAPQQSTTAPNGIPQPQPTNLLNRPSTPPNPTTTANGQPSPPTSPLTPTTAFISSLTAARPGTSSSSDPFTSHNPNNTTTTSASSKPLTSTQTAHLNRLAMRDRSYALLSSLTRLAHGWDDAEAWFALARAYEYSGQEEKAKEALWRVVGLEDSGTGLRGRGWRDASPGGFVL